MRTAFGNEHLVSVLELLEMGRAVDGLCEVAFVARHEDGEGREAYAGRHDAADDAENLAVRNDEGRVLPQFFQRFRQFVFPRDEGDGTGIEDVADGLLLRQDQPSLGSRLVDRDDEDDEVPGPDQVGTDGEGRRLFGHQAGQGLPQLVDVAFRGTADDLVGNMGGADFGHAGNVFFRLFQVLSAAGQLVGLREDEQGRQLFGADAVEEGHVLGGRAGSRLDDEEGDVRFIEDLVGPLHAQAAQFAFVVDTRRVNQQHRAQRQQLHRLGHGVRRGPRRVGHDGQVLVRQGVDKARLAGIAAAEDTDMDAVRRRGGVQSAVSAHGETSLQNNKQ